MYKDWLFVYPAVEFLSFLLYYSIPVLQDILSEPYFQHYCLLDGSLHILLGERITGPMLNAAEIALQQFYEEWPTLYGTVYYKFVTSHTNTIMLID